MSRIAVVGTGYVGLTTGACLSSLGHDVVCIDVDAEKVELLRGGEIPIYEEGLRELVVDGLRLGTLRFTTELDSVRDREFVYLCVPTPQSSDGSADLSFVERAAADLGPLVADDAVIINKSTVPVGSTGVVECAMGRDHAHVVSNPEFLREGTAVADFLNPDRVVIGAVEPDVAIRVAALYTALAAPVIVTDPASAELIKYASNAFLATKISFVNAVAAVSEAVGADMKDVVLGIGYDHRIGKEFLRPGPGWGGSCFPKDTKALIRIAADAGYQFSLLEGVVAVNEQQFDRVVDKVAGMLGGDVAGRVIAAWGLTFKARTDDRRDSPAIEIIQRLVRAGARVQAYDPAVPVGLELLEGVEVVGDSYAACSGADVVVVLTEWDEFRWLDFDKVAGELNELRIVDARNLLDRNSLVSRSFEYSGIGRS